LWFLRSSGSYISWGRYSEMIAQKSQLYFMSETVYKSTENIWKKSGGVIKW